MTRDIAEVSRLLQSYTLADGTKPHIQPRQPFSKIGNKTLQKTIELFHEFPRKRGLISDALREIYGTKETYPDQFVRFEAHFNIGEVDQLIEDEIVSFGFEPDDFVELHPPEYKRNFTFAYDADNPVEERFRTNFLKKTCHELMLALSNKHDGPYFVEAERFASSNIKIFDTSNPRKSILPLNRYEVVHVPETNEETNEYGFTPQTRKSIDVHIKLKGIVIPDDDYEMGRSIETKEHLAFALNQLGLYRITSVSGNTIYTAQFYNGEKAKKFIETMTQFLEETGLAESLISEPCFLFLRSCKEGQYAPVCHLLE